MRYDAVQVDYLAAEYVIGTLRGPARRRFDRLITDRADVRLAVWRWERHLNSLALGVEPQQPAPRVWHNISRRVDRSTQSKPGLMTRWRGLWLTLPTAAAAAWLAIALFPTPAQDRVAVFADQDAATLWVVAADLDTGVLQTETVNAPALAIGSSYELWILRGNEPPLSLGLLAVDPGSIETAISTELIAALTGAGRLAISIEPAGGSPTGLPTGPVVYQASLVVI